MRIRILAFGRGAGTPEQALTLAYLSRLSPRPELVEVTRLPFPPAAPGTLTVVLDERGENWPSAEFARRLARWREAGVRELRFLVGPPDGFDPATRQAAQVRLAFGAQTWPHLLVRAMLAEQLWRASTIAAGHPYHRA